MLQEILAYHVIRSFSAYADLTQLQRTLPVLFPNTSYHGLTYQTNYAFRYNLAWQPLAQSVIYLQFLIQRPAPYVAVATSCCFDCLLHIPSLRAIPERIARFYCGLDSSTAA